MVADHEAVVRSFLDCIVRRDLEAALDHYADDAVYHVNAWREPLVGITAIREGVGQEIALSNYRYTIVNLASRGAAVLFEVVDEFETRGKRVSMHWAGAWEINRAGKITARRDYWDGRESESQRD
jgi:limonene-1,2-epoxide hydrolase